ncbi:MAG: hypothetical protein WDM94_12395 [Bauldia sp.]
MIYFKLRMAMRAMSRSAAGAVPPRAATLMPTMVAPRNSAAARASSLRSTLPSAFAAAIVRSKAVRSRPAGGLVERVDLVVGAAELAGCHHAHAALRGDSLRPRGEGDQRGFQLCQRRPPPRPCWR